MLIVGWGGTYGSLRNSLDEFKAQNPDLKVGLAHFNYIYPLPLNTDEIFSKFKKIIVCELNFGQFANYLRTVFEFYHFGQFNKLKGQPFMVAELVDAYKKYMEE